MTKSPYISIIIISYNSAQFINACLKSIYRQTFKNFEIIIIDNASKDQTFDQIKPRYLTKTNLNFRKNLKNLGSAKARNQGAKLAKGQYLLFLDPDTVLSPNCLAQFNNLTQKHPQLGAAQAKLLNLERKQYFDSAGERLDPLGFLVDRASGAKDTGQLDYLAPILAGKTAAVLVKLEAFKAIKGFDETYFFLLEDGDLFWRLWLHGFPVIFYPNAVVYHAFNTKIKNQQKTLHYTTKLTRFYGSRNYLYTLLKNLSFKKLITILPLHLLSWISVSLMLLIKLKFNQSLAIIKGLGWNFVNLPFIISQRRKIQTNRSLSDQELNFLFIPRPSISHYIKKIISYVQE